MGWVHGERFFRQRMVVAMSRPPPVADVGMRNALELLRSAAGSGRYALYTCRAGNPCPTFFHRLLTRIEVDH